MEMLVGGAASLAAIAGLALMIGGILEALK
jgi:hypothetical protein